MNAPNGSAGDAARDGGAPGRTDDAGRRPERDPRTPDDAVERAVAAFAHALRLSCLAARHPAAPTLTNDAVSAHVAARAWPEEAVRRAEHA
ncbi:hypothetical protein tb265_06840 [Gemmatimonadetes bacterium T265]|nr:hypothetical protein tb265_06840 [Gemmatimonadetes bacterium T265]